VWFNVSNDNTGGWLNEKITVDITEELVNNLVEPCKAAAEVRRNVCRRVSWQEANFIGDQKALCKNLLPLNGSLILFYALCLFFLRKL